MADSQEGDVEINEDFEWGFSFSETDTDTQLDTAVEKVSSAASADLSPLVSKLDLIISLIPEPLEIPDVDLSPLSKKLDTIIALERVDALTAGDMPDLTPLSDKLDEILAKETTVNAPEVNVDLSAIEEKLEQLDVTVGEVRDLDFDGDGTVDFGDINNILTDLLQRQENQEAELDAKKAEFDDFKKNKLKALENMIIPLLKNLKSNPDKNYIHCPNRAGILDAQITKILGLTR
jgi:hypothetical protein